ncbi:MAG: hypothetical protein K6T61_01640 [Bryobacteraceae bacterium]|nr:hypothetical protein [Bryobacteraceae bacterium]
MKIRLLYLLLAAVPLSAWAANFSGQWAIQVPRAGRADQMETLYLSLNHAGNTVSGHLRTAVPPYTGSPLNTEIWDGKVEGDTISFYVWVGQDRPAKVQYKGVLSGDEIQFTITGGAPSFNIRGELNPPPPPRKGVARRVP